jgi:PAS domain S-box-containing protein
MDDLASSGAGIQSVILDAVCDALAISLVIYDRDDQVVFASRRMQAFSALSGTNVSMGARLRDVLGAIYDYRKSLLSGSNSTASTGCTEREDWVSDQLASHWKERSERIEQVADKWLRYAQKRLPSGLGICVVTDFTEQKKREDQWRSDIERVQVTEEILDNLPFSIFVKDRNTAYVAVNRAGCALLETTSDMILGRTVFDIHSNPLGQRIDALDRHVLETGIPSTLPERVTRLKGEEALVITRKQRIGKPGRYFLVTTMDDVTPYGMTGEDGRSFIPGLKHLTFEQSSYVGVGKHRSSQMLKGRSILLVTANEKLGLLARQNLGAANVDFALVSDYAQQKACFDVAASAGVKIDLVIVDVQMEFACLELPRAYRVDVITLDEFQAQNALLDIVARHFQSASQLSSVANEDGEWKISTSVAPVAPAARKNLDVLVVEDNDINQIVFSQILDGFGLRYKIATSAQEALHLFEKDNPSVIFMDTTLPDFDGFEAARRIRKMEGSHARRTPIIGVVALAFEGDRQACAQAGMDDMLLKPISPDMIEVLLKRFMPQDETRITG